MYGVALWTSTLLALVGARLYEQCELARDLLRLGVRKDHIATWVCIAYHESRFDTSARNPSSGDHGLLQISEIYWCGAGKACGLPCSALRDDDISDDVECAQTIYEEHTRLQGNGFLAWVVYPHYCKHNPKKYLTDCDFSVKDTGYKIEERTPLSHVYDSYPSVNVTLQNPVQSVSYPQSDRSLPSYLSIISLIRGKFEQDFERDYNKRVSVNWSRIKIDNVDDLKIPDLNQRPNYDFLAPLTTQITTTSTTTIEPELQYKPVKPWRTIETNQFRRRMMNLNKTILEEVTNKPAYQSSFARTTPRPTTTVAIANSISSTYKSPSEMNTFINLTETPSILSVTTQKPVTSIISPAPQKLPNYTKINSTNGPLKNKDIDITVNRVKTFWETYGHLTTQSPNLKGIPYTRKPMETSTVKSNTSPQLMKQQSSTSQTTTTGSPLLKTEYDIQRFSSLNTITTTPKVKEIYSATSSTWSATKAWRVGQPYYVQNYSAHKLNDINYRTERPQTLAWRRGKSWPENYQNVTTYDTIVTTIKPTVTSYTTTSKKILSSATQLFNRGSDVSDKFLYSSQKMLPTTETTPFLTTNSLPKPTFGIIAEERETTTEKKAVTTPTTPKTTLSIFDLYLNPTKRTLTPNYKFLFSNNSSANLRIFSGGTTPAPVNKNISKRTEIFTSEVQHQIKA